MLTNLFEILWIIVKFIGTLAFISYHLSIKLIDSKPLQGLPANLKILTPGLSKAN